MGLLVNGQTIEDRQIEREINRLRPEYEQAFVDMDPVAREAQLRDWATENLIERILVAQEAERSDIAVPPDEIDRAFSALKEGCEDPKQALEALECNDDHHARLRVREDLKATKLMDRVGRTAPVPSREQIEQYYREHADEFVQPEQVHVAHIVKFVSSQCDEQTAAQIIQRALADLEQGVPFELLVERYSDRPEQGRPGPITRGQAVEEFEDVIFNLGPGQVSSVFRTRYGFHIAKVYELIPPKTLSLGQVRSHIHAGLSEKLRSEAIYAFVDGLRAKARIENSP